NAPCGLANRRIIRSSTVAGIGVALPWPGTSSAPGMHSLQAYAPLRSSAALARALRARQQANHPLLDGCRHRSGFALARDEFGTGNVFVPGVRSTEHFDTGATLAV